MNPNEIFTYPILTKTAEANNAIETHNCRFTNKKCDKQSRLIGYPMGVCSVNHSGAKPIICPHRFLENNLVFKNACDAAFGTTNNVLLFSEVKLKNVGSFDFVLVKHKPISNEVEDFCVVEFQSDSTTGTGALVKSLKDFMEGEDISQKKYKFGMNTYNTIKLSYMQMLIKGQVMEKWDKKIFWVMQKFVYDNMVKRFHLIDLGFDQEDKTHYHVYDLIGNDLIYNLELVDMTSTTVANLIKAFTHQPTPSIDKFIKVLEEKIKLRLNLVL